ncbi:MAG: TolC family protein [Ignavibacteria bacterium]|nr:TolC family protein [Ignavibacteria bacterium]
MQNFRHRYLKTGLFMHSLHILTKTLQLPMFFALYYGLALLLCSGLEVYAQNTVLTLKECVRLAQTQGPAAEIARSAYRNRFHRYESFTAGLLPQFSLEGTLPNITRAINSIPQPDGSLLFRSQSQAQSSAGINISQQIPLTGGQLFIGSSLSRIDLFGENASKLWSVSPLVLGISQPLFQLNTVSWNIREQEIMIDIARKQFHEAMEDIAMEAVARFFDVYLAQMNVENARLNVIINDSTYRLSQGRFTVGKIAENDVLQNELSLLNAQMSFSTAQLEVLNAKQNLAITLGISTNNYSIESPQNSNTVRIDSAIAMEIALRNRSEIRNFELQKLSAERFTTQTTLQNSFNATLSATVGLNQTAQTVPNALNNLLDRQTFSLSIGMPLFQWGKATHDKEAAQAEEQRTLLNSNLQIHLLRQELTNHIQRMMLLDKQIVIAKKTEEIAQKRYEMTKNRYLIGKIDIKDVLLAQSEKDAAFRTFAQTLRDFWTGYYRLRRLTLYDFEDKKVIEYDTRM